MTDMKYQVLLPQIKQWLEEDDLNRNFYYIKSLPDVPVQLNLKIKSDLVMAGVDYFVATFLALGASEDQFEFMQGWDGKSFSSGENIHFPTPLPFALALTAERLALNLLQHASSIATWTHKHVSLAAEHGIKLLDTRKTTPGMRALEKYAVRVGGGFNHRLGQTDLWMIKDNHKSALGGLAAALEFFQSQGVFYNNIIAEIHNLTELREALDLGIRHVMLDNFSIQDIHAAVKLKRPGMTFEVSGGIKLQNLQDYLISGVDALSMGSLTYGAPRLDLSLKFKPL
jgi:nicotinate-nucleotide pyrophosphorylase (carboxylating)